MNEDFFKKFELNNCTIEQLIGTQYVDKIECETMMVQQQIVSSKFQDYSTCVSCSGKAGSKSQGQGQGQSRQLRLTEEQRKRFDRAEEAGLMAKRGDGYEWLGSLALLAYFVGRVFCKDKPVRNSEGKLIWDVSGEQLPATALERLFGRGDFAGYRNKRQYSGIPRDHKLVDDLF